MSFQSKTGKAGVKKFLKAKWLKKVRKIQKLEREVAVLRALLNER